MRVSLLFAALVVSACADSPDVSGTAETVSEALTPSPSAPERAVAEIAEVDGSGVSGQVEFTSLGDDAIEVRFNLEGLAAGLHGFHIHQTGDCSPDSTGTPAGAAGDHFNPLSSPHGAPDSTAAHRHAGDLGNIVVEAGQAVGTRIDSVLAFDGPTSILGKAVIVHAGEDDMASQPSGDAGARVGCGVIREGRASAAPQPGSSDS